MNAKNIFMTRNRALWFAALRGREAQKNVYFKRIVLRKLRMKSESVEMGGFEPRR